MVNRFIDKCASCRRLKIKCDQARPTCEYCLATNKLCQYLTTTRVSTNEISGGDLCSDSSCSLLDIQLKKTKLYHQSEVINQFNDYQYDQIHSISHPDLVHKIRNKNNNEIDNQNAPVFIKTHTQNTSKFGNVSGNASERVNAVSTVKWSPNKTETPVVNISQFGDVSLNLNSFENSDLCLENSNFISQNSISSTINSDFLDLDPNIYRDLREPVDDGDAVTSFKSHRSFNSSTSDITLDDLKTSHELPYNASSSSPLLKKDYLELSESNILVSIQNELGKSTELRNQIADNIIIFKNELNSINSNDSLIHNSSEASDLSIQNRHVKSVKSSNHSTMKSSNTLDTIAIYDPDKFDTLTFINSLNLVSFNVQHFQQLSQDKCHQDKSPLDEFNYESMSEKLHNFHLHDSKCSISTLNSNFFNHGEPNNQDFIENDVQSKISLPIEPTIDTSSIFSNRDNQHQNLSSPLLMVKNQKHVLNKKRLQLTQYDHLLHGCALNSSTKLMNIDMFELRLLNYFENICIPMFCYGPQDNIYKTWKTVFPPLFLQSNLVRTSVYSFASINLLPIIDMDQVIKDDPCKTFDIFQKRTIDYFVDTTNNVTNGVKQLDLQNIDGPTVSELIISGILLYSYIAIHHNHVCPLIPNDGENKCLHKISVGLRQILKASALIIQTTDINKLFWRNSEDAIEFDSIYPLVQSLVNDLYKYYSIDGKDLQIDCELSKLKKSLDKVQESMCVCV
jgi:hypothetical protein